MNTQNDFDQNYLKLILEINKHMDGYIDAYIGPANLKEEIGAQPPNSVSLLQKQVDWLRGKCRHAAALARGRYFRGNRYDGRGNHLSPAGTHKLDAGCLAANDSYGSPGISRSFLECARSDAAVAVGSRQRCYHVPHRTKFPRADYRIFADLWIGLYRKGGTKLQFHHPPTLPFIYFYLYGGLRTDKQVRQV